MGSLPRGGWRFRHGWLGRFRLPRNIRWDVRDVVFEPVYHTPLNDVRNQVLLYPDELEAMRLVYLENKTQEEAARIMGVSRGTLWRLLDSGRRKVTEALVYLKPIRIIGFSTLHDPSYLARLGIHVRRGEEHE